MNESPTTPSSFTATGSVRLVSNATGGGASLPLFVNQRWLIGLAREQIIRSLGRGSEFHSCPHVEYDWLQFVHVRRLLRPLEIAELISKLQIDGKGSMGAVLIERSLRRVGFDVYLRSAKNVALCWSFSVSSKPSTPSILSQSRLRSPCRSQLYAGCYRNPRLVSAGRSSEKELSSRSIYVCSFCTLHVAIITPRYLMPLNAGHCVC